MEVQQGYVVEVVEPVTPWRMKESEKGYISIISNCLSK